MKVQFFVNNGHSDVEAFIENFYEGLDFYELADAEDGPFDPLANLTFIITDGVDYLEISEDEVEDDIIYAFLDSIYERRKTISQWYVKEFMQLYSLIEQDYYRD